MGRAASDSGLDQGPLRRIVRLAGGHHDIHDPGDLVGQRHGRYVGMAAWRRPFNPMAQRLVGSSLRSTQRSTARAP